MDVAIDYCVDQIQPNMKWPERISKFSVQQIYEYSSMKIVMRAICEHLEPDMCLVEGGKWQKDRFTPMTFRARGGRRALAGWSFVEMLTGRGFCPGSLGDGVVL